MRTVAVVLAALAIAACVSLPAREEAGRAAAERDIEAGTPCVLEFGRMGPETQLDRETGLPISSFGCLVSDESTAYVEAHNDAIRGALRAGRLRGMTLKDRWTTVEAVAARFEREGGIPVAPGDSPLTVPGTGFQVEVAPRNNQGDMRPYFFVTNPEGGSRRELHPFRAPKMRVLFEHEGRTLLVRDDLLREYLTFDLAWPLKLQVFPGD